jgi:GTPase SAR1 family protein
LLFARMTLLLGPPGAGKSTLLLALAGKLDSDLEVRNWSLCLPLSLSLGCFWMGVQLPTSSIWAYKV